MKIRELLLGQENVSGTRGTSSTYEI